MNRLIWITPKVKKPIAPQVAGARGAEDAPSDGVMSRIVKLVPTEIVAGYVPLAAAAETFTGDSRRFVLAVTAFVIGLIVTPVYLCRVGKPRRWFEWAHVGVSTLAFVFWAYLLGGPFAMSQMDAYLWPYDKQLAGFVVGAFTWIAGMFPFQAIESKNSG